MPTLQELKKEINIDFPLQQVWEAIPKAVDQLDWEIVKQNSFAYEFIIRTAQALVSYFLILEVELTALGQETTHIVIYGEIPVTTINSTQPVNLTDNEINHFVSALSETMHFKILK